MIYAEADLKERSLITLSSILELDVAKEVIGDDLLTGYWPSILSHIMSQIFDLKHENEDVKNNIYEKNIEKIQLFSARSLLNEKEQLSLKEFIETMKNTFEVILDNQSLAKIDKRNKEINPKNNLFEGLSEMDLTFLRSHVYILYKTSINDLDHKIALVDYYNLGSTLKERIDAMHALKKKWSKPELQAFLGEFLDDFDGDINQLLSKEFKSSKEPNPLCSEGMIFLYQKKF
jgi:hypothetical protein